MLNVTDVLDDPDFLAPFTVIRAVERVTEKGRAERTEETFTAAGCVQPATAREREVLPEGERDRETLVIYTRTALRTGDEAEGTAADAIDVNGVRYTVSAVEAWPHYVRALAQRTQADAGNLAAREGGRYLEAQGNG